VVAIKTVGFTVLPSSQCLLARNPFDHDAVRSEFQEWYNGLKRNPQAKIAGVLRPVVNLTVAENRVLTLIQAISPVAGVLGRRTAASRLW
jgi:hypothetical protein